MSVGASVDDGVMQVGSVTGDQEEEEDMKRSLVDAKDDDEEEEEEQQQFDKGFDVDAKLPWDVLGPLYFSQFCESWNSDSLFAYVAFLVWDFSPGLTKEQVGRWAGFVASTYFFGSFLSSYIWGFLSDRWGRKKLIMLGMTGTIISIVVFGFSQSLWYAVFARALSGVLNGNIGVAKALVGEVTTSKTQAASFGNFAIAWGLGTVCGSIMGGLLAQPAKKWDLFVGTVFETFPYLLTNILNACVMLIGLLVVTVFLKEPPKKPKPRIVDDEDVPTQSRWLRVKARLRRVLWVFRESQIMLPIMAYVFIGGVNTFLKESIPLFYVAKPEVGGLNFDTTKTGAINSVPGVVSIFFQLFAYRRVVDRLGLIRTFRLGCVGAAFANSFFPLVNLLYRGPDDLNIAMWCALCSIFLIQPCAVQCMFASVFALISNSSDRERMGTVNGVSQSLVAFTRATAPIAAGNIFQWSIDSTPSHAFPFNVWFNFLIQFVLFNAIGLMTFAFSPRLDKPRAEHVETELISVASATSIDLEEE